MSDRADDEGNTEAAVAGGEDLIGALPDDVLRYLMSFLLSREAVRTCVLAKRWRTLWKSVPALHIDDLESYDGATGTSTFVDELIRLRDPTPLNVCTISSECGEGVGGDSDWDEEVFERMAPWLQHVLSCQVQELTVFFPLRVTNMIFISSHLKRLNLYRMRFEGHSLDISSCQVLEVLKMDLCDIFADISSHSLKYLYIDNSCFDWDTRSFIFAPNLVGFRLLVDGGLTPYIYSMPSLVTASVTLEESCADLCCCDNLSCEECSGEAGDVNRSIVLEGLSGATNLELEIYDPALFIFRKDLKWCPMFSKLKAVVLNAWCLVNNFTGLIYLLQHSPLLETLMLRLDFGTHEKQRETKTVKRYNSSEQSLLSKHLKLVKIICETKGDKRVHRILRILLAHGVRSEQIEIQ